MIRLEYKWPQHQPDGYNDTWKDQPTRANLDKAAAKLERGDLTDFWDGETVQIGENRNAELAKQASGFLVSDKELLGD